MQVKLEYGRDGLLVDLPDENVVVLNLKTSPPLDEVETAVRSSLRSPIGSESLVELARSKHNVVITICDKTRPVPNKTLLPPILECLNSADVADDQITILIATGTHRPNDEAELLEMLGEEITSRIRIVNHICTDTAGQIGLGVSPNGVPIALDKIWVDADLRISVGLIEPHFMAGFSGGRKLVMPGLAALETVQAWHSPRFLEHPNATNGITDGNPVHEEAMAIAKMARTDFIVDVTLDEANQITGIFAGDMEAAWNAGVEFARTQVKVSISEQVDIAITTCAGLPLDATFYQTVKGMVGALPLVKLGGEIIIASECSEGIGSSHFKSMLFDYSDLNTFISDIQSPDWTYIPDQWEVEVLARAANHATITCVSSGISDADLSQCFVTPAATVEQAVQIAQTRLGRSVTIGVIPKGPYVIPVVL
ncbi:MAG: nickel-dependent lactate racemase [Chthonomonadales bacterium]